MKKIKFSLFLLLCSVTGFAQVYTDATSGNVGIGTTTPQSLLHLKRTFIGNDAISIIRNSESPNLDFYSTYNGSDDLQSGTFAYGVRPVDDAWQIYHKQTNTNWEALFSVRPNGNIGIGTSTPTEKLSIYGTVNSAPGIMSLESSRNDAGFVEVGAISTKNNGGEIARMGMFRGSGTYTGLINFLVRPSNDGPLTEAMRIAENGNLLIGKTIQTNSTYKLDINGKARANEIVVNTTGADFVFEKDYKLRSLKAVEAFVKQNKHLPEVPSAKFMQENGLGVSEMQTKLLQKVEELTLYLIEQNKRIADYESNQQKQQIEIEKLKKLLNKK